MDKHTKKIIIDPKGPYAVHGKLNILEYFIINGKDGKPLRYEQGDTNYSNGEVTYLCRCGASKKKPYCDGSHLQIECNDDLTAVKDKFINNVKIYEGPYYTLYDKESLCASARFCNLRNGVWEMVMNPQNQEDIDSSVQGAQMCPAGRLVVQDKKTDKIMEPHIEPSIGLIEDTPMETSGPIWVRGGVPITIKDGEELERRNRVTLCRCGASKHKPYCDGAHLRVHFKDDNF